MLPVNLTDVTGLMVLYDCRIRARRADEEVVSHTDYFGQVRHCSLVAQLTTNEGVFVFGCRDSSHKFYDPGPLVYEGLWDFEVTPTAGEVELMVTARVAPTHLGVLVMVDERSGLAVLELGNLTRDDDPNMRAPMVRRQRFDPAGFESALLDLLAPAEPDDTVDITRPEIAPEFKRANYSGRGRRKGSWAR